MYSTWRRPIFFHLTKMSQEVRGVFWELKQPRKSSGDTKTRIMRTLNGGGRDGRRGNLAPHIFSLMSHCRNHYLPPELEMHPSSIGLPNDERHSDYQRN